MCFPDDGAAGKERTAGQSSAVTSTEIPAALTVNQETRPRKDCMSATRGGHVPARGIVLGGAPCGDSSQASLTCCDKDPLADCRLQPGMAQRTVRQEQQNVASSVRGPLRPEDARLGRFEAWKDRC